MSQSSKDLEDLRKGWFDKVEKDSENLFEVAEAVSRDNPDMKVVIVKRFPRYDKPSDDILGVKAKLSVFANSVYDQLMIRKCPKNIEIVEFQFGLNTSKPDYLKEILFGHSNSQKYDGYHLNGVAGRRHLTYRAIQAVRPITAHVSQLLGQSEERTSESTDSQQTRNMRRRKNNPQQYQGKSNVGSYAQVAGQGTSRGNNYSVPVNNGFVVLGN